MIVNKCRRFHIELQGEILMELMLQQKQTLNLVMTPELRQAIELLQFSTYELYQFLQERALENPLIDLVEKHDVPGDQAPSIWKVDDENKNPIDFVSSGEKGMREILIDQARWLNITEKNWNVLRYLILNLDENGYLPLTNNEIATQLNISNEKVEEGIQLLQRMEPAGLGARNLSECLLLQVQRYYPDEKLAKKVITEHLQLLADRKWETIAKKCNVTLEQVKEVYDLIQTLNPRPCTNISNPSVEYLHPDIIVEEEAGTFHIYLNDSYLPDIQFNSDYSELLSDKVPAYVQNQFKNYQWLKNSMEQRRTTILKIMEVIINKQRDFFINGFKSLQPLTLKDVAKEIGMHESTVSRATANKVIQTPKGSFDLRLLFSTKLEGSQGETTSQTKVKVLLEDIIKKEDKYKPLSDQKISDLLKEQGIKISRRTVAKYREELNIPSSSRRKEIKV